MKAAPATDFWLATTSVAGQGSGRAESGNL